MSMISPGNPDVPALGQTGDSKTRICIGNSMAPTLLKGEYFCSVPISLTRIRPGDILLFRPSKHKMDVVHRAVLCNQAGIRTRGDNVRNKTDLWTLKEHEIIGIVTTVYRSGKPYRLLHGWKGLLWHHFLRLRSMLIGWIRKPCYPLYLISSRYLYLGWLLPKRRRPIFLKIDHNGCYSWKIVCASKQIGYRKHEESPWVIRFPYRYVIRPLDLKQIT